MTNLRIPLGTHGTIMHVVSDFRRVKGLGCEGWAVDVELYNRGRPTIAWTLGRIDGEEAWGVDAEYTTWLDSDSLTCPVKVNGFGSPGCARSALKATAGAVLSKLVDKAVEGEGEVVQIALPGIDTH